MRTVALGVLQIAMLAACSAQMLPNPHSNKPLGVDATRRAIASADGTLLGVSERSSNRLADGSTKVRTRKTLRIKETDAPRRRVTQETTAHYAAGKERSRIFALTERSATGAAIRITRSIPGDSRAVLLDLPSDIAFDQGATLFKSALEAQAALAPTVIPVELKFHVVDFDAPAIREVSIREVESEQADTRLFERRLYSTRFANRALQSVTFMSFNTQTQTSDTLQTSFGGGVRIDAHEDQISSFSAASLVSEVLVKSPARIPAAARMAHVLVAKRS